MGPGDEHHCRIVFIDIIDSQPDRDGPRGRQFPERGVLVPWNSLRIVRLFRENVARPANDVRSEDIFDAINDARIRDNVPQSLETGLETVDAIVAVRSESGHEAVDVLSYFGDFRRVEDFDGTDKAP